jgi:YD repeat-containing protein
LESNGLVTLEAENGQRIDGPTHAWLTSTAITGYTGTNYLHVLPDTDTFYSTAAITDSPRIEYLVNFTTPATYTVWVRGYADNADADALNVGLANDRTAVTGFAPETWAWASGFEELVIQTSGVHTLTVWMAEDGFRLDRLLLTTDTNYIPTSFGPTESEQQPGSGGPTELLDHTIVYTYDNLYRLTDADYSTGELYEYDYDPVGNRLQQIVNGDTTDYLYDSANRLEAVDGQSYNFDANPLALLRGLRGNLLTTGAMTNTWDAANRLVETTTGNSPLAPHYNGVGDRVGQTVGGNTTDFALDVIGLSEVIYTSL